MITRRALPWVVSLLVVVGAAVFSTRPTEAAPPEEIVGRVIGANDADSLWLRVGNQQIMVRCWGVDAPEYSQRYGHKAYQFAIDTLLGKEVTVRVMDRDQYNRIVGYVTYDGGKVWQEELLKAGYAWVYSSYLPWQVKQAWDPLMKKAQDEKRGLWLDEYPVPPWVYRKSHH